MTSGPSVTNSSITSSTKVNISNNNTLKHNNSLTDLKGSIRATSSKLNPSSTANQLKRTFSQPNLNLFKNQQPKLNSNVKKRKKESESSSMITVNDSEEDTIDAIATSYKKRLSNKERENTEAKVRIEELEECIDRQNSTIQEFIKGEDVNIKVMEYNLASYSRDKKR